MPMSAVRLEEAEIVLPYELERPDRHKAEIRLTRLDAENGVLEFDLLHVETALANALRRILIAEVPTIAAEKVLLYQNTSVIPDDVLCHRLGLVPLRIDPRQFRDCHDLERRLQQVPMEFDPLSVVIFDLDVQCRTKDDGTLEHDRVYSKDLRWVPIGDQAARYESGTRPRPVLPDILLARLGPGAHIHARLICVRGIGQDHAKFSPVATATYRLLSDIRLTQEVSGPLAERLRDCFAKDVITISEPGGIATVADPRLDIACSREALRDPELRECVSLGLVRDHFMFSVESTGCLPPEELVREALKILMLKCQKFLQLLGQE